MVRFEILKRFRPIQQCYIHYHIGALILHVKQLFIPNFHFLTVKRKIIISHAHGIIIIPRNELYRFKRYRVRIIYRRCWLKKLKKNIPSLDSMLAWVAGIWSLSRLSLRDSREAMMASEAAFWDSYSVTVWSNPAAK